MTRVDFWFEFASTYSYPAAMRIDRLASERAIAVRWRPFLLGPIFAAQGWRDSPFNLYPAKGRYMWRDLERICQKQALALVRPDPFPQNSVLAARTALTLEDEQRAAFSRAIYAAEFGEGKPIADRNVVGHVLDSLGCRPAEILTQAISEPIKAKLRSETEEAQRLGIFGAPACVTEGGELFWGNDRLEDALEWALWRG